jgi:hypothetical protein
MVGRRNQMVGIKTKWKIGFRASVQQGCQIVCFQTKNPNLGKFWSALEWKMLVHVMVISMVFWYIIWPFGNVVVIGIFSLVLVYCVKKNLATLRLNHFIFFAGWLVGFVRAGSHFCSDFFLAAAVERKKNLPGQFHN